MKLNWLKNYSILSFESLDSTNSEGLRLANSSARGDFLILGQEQTGGRGQRGREWVSLHGNLHASILLESRADPKSHPQLSFVIANAMYASLAELAAKHRLSMNIELKWPNDILINGKKVAGILLESISLANKISVVIGFGVNIRQAPSDLDRPATSLLNEGIILEKPDEFLNILMNRFDKLYARWRVEKSFTDTRKYWMRHAYNLNKQVTIDDGTRSVSGIFREIDLDGAMRLELPNGQFCTIYAGEIIMDEGCS